MSIYLSASSISDFIKCPQKVLYRRTKPFPEVRSKEMIVGEIAHKAIEVGWDNRQLALEVINRMSKENNLGAKEKGDLEFCIDVYFLNFRRLLNKDDLVEYNFKFPLHDDIFLVGKMDRIYNENILDWKTGKVSTKLSSDPQCIIYDYAYRKIFGKEPSSICIASLSTGELIPYRSEKFKVKELFENIIPRMIKTIKTESYERLGMFNHSCFRCPYKLGCLGGIEEEYVVDSTISAE